MSWNLLTSIRRMESVEGVVDAACQGIGVPAAKRCFPFVNQTRISDPGCFASGLGARPTGFDRCAAGETSTSAPARSAPKPRNVVLRKVRLDFTIFVCLMRPLGGADLQGLDQPDPGEQ